MPAATRREGVLRRGPAGLQTRIRRRGLGSTCLGGRRGGPAEERIAGRETRGHGTGGYRAGGLAPFGGKARFMHKGRRKVKGTCPIGKTIAMAVVERSRVKGAQTVRAKVIPDTKRTALHPEIAANVEPGTMVYTDELPSYTGMSAEYIHQAVDHSREYVRGRCHTNNADNFWCLLKRTIRGTYVHCQPYHLNRYLAEQVFRYNERKDNDGERFQKVIAAVAGKRVTYDELVGKGMAYEETGHGAG